MGMIEVEDIKFAMHVIPLLVITVLVAVSAFALQRREVFLTGVAGAVMLSLVPQRMICAEYRTVEAAVMGMFNDIYEHAWFWGIVGAFLGSAAGVSIVSLYKRKSRRLTPVSLQRVS